MSPSAVRSSSAHDRFEDDMNLSIVGLGVQYPPYKMRPEALDVLAKRFYPESTALSKVLTINKFTGINTRSTVGDLDHPIANQADPPSIKQLNDLFMDIGVDLSVRACRQAMAEWGGRADDITHVVSTTCTNSANPGFDHFVARALGLPRGVEKVLLHGIGCSGGLAAIRTAANLALGATCRRRPARVLVLACEISSILVRSELASVVAEQETRIGVCLFSDCASACVLSNGLGDAPSGPAIYELVGWKHDIIEETERDLGFDVDPLGWKVVLSPRVPALTAAAVPQAFDSLLASLPASPALALPTRACDFDWALHPGGSTVIAGVEQAMGLTPEHLQASYEVYVEHGNSSSATIMSVMHVLRGKPGGREDVIACAFGPGIAIEMMALKRRTGVDALPVEDLD